VTLLTVIASMGEPSELTMLRIVPQTPEDLDPDSAVGVADQEVITNPMVAKAVVAAMVNQAVTVAAMVAVAVAVDKEADPMARAAVVLMVNNSSIKVNKVAIHDSLEHSWFTKVSTEGCFEIPPLG
jgi:hypothetical protein